MDLWPRVLGLKLAEMAHDMRTIALFLLPLLGSCASLDYEPLDQELQDETDPASEIEFPLLATNYHIHIDSQRFVQSASSGDEFTQTITADVLTTVEQDGGNMTFRVQACAATPPKLNGIQPSIASDFLRNDVPAVEVSARLVPTESGFHLENEPVTIILGAELENPDDPLPARSGDQGIVDQDNDGEEGITIDVAIFSVYAAAKIQLALSADIDPLDGLDQIFGTADFSLETAIYDDSIPFVNARKTAAEDEEDTIVLAESHQFSMIAVPEGTSCIDL